MSRLRHLQELFEHACELPPEHQGAFVDQACAGDAVLHAELSDLLASDDVVKDHTARKAVGDLSALLQQGQPDALVGAQVGRYMLKSCVGAGGMGSVYLAERNDGVVRQTVAIKFLGRDLLGDSFRQRFEIEREILAKLDHPNITRLIDAEELPDGTPYYVMDYVEGEPITRYAFNQQLDVGARLKLFVEVGKAVAHAHQALIVHRDIKPGNILVDAQGVPHLLDFGIAKPLAQLGAQMVSMTATGQRFFSPQHAAPEQLLGGNITVGCDVYGLGCLLYELLSGEPAIPLTGLTATEAEKKILHQLPQAPSQRVLSSEKNDERAAGFGIATVKSWSKAISGEIDSIVLNCLRKLPHERYRSVDDLIADVQAYQTGMPIAAKSSHRWYRAKKFVSRHRWAVTAAALTAVALVSSSVITALQSREATLQRDVAESTLVQAEQQRDRAQRVTQFLIDAFAAANPGGELGKSVTAKDILDHGAKKLETDLQEQPELRAQLLATISGAQLALTLHDDAAVTAEAAVKLIKGNEGTADCFAPYASLAAVLIDQRHIEKATETVRLLEECARNPEQMFDATYTRIDLYTKTGELSDLIEISTKTLNAAELESWGIPPKKMLNMRRRRAGSYSAMGQERKGYEEARLVVNAVKSVGILDPAFRIRALKTLSITESRLEMWEQSIEHATDAVQITRDIFGEKSDRYLSASMTLANNYAAADDWASAKSLGEAILRTGQEIYGVNSPETFTYWYSMALYLDKSGQFEEAAREMAGLVDAAELQLPVAGRGLFIFRSALARLLHKAGHCHRAEIIEKIAVRGFGKSTNAEKYRKFRAMFEKIELGTTVCSD